MQKKKTELSFASVVLMLLVIFIHVASEFVSNGDRSSPVFAGMLSLHRLSSFAVQGFIFLSGLKLFLRKDGFSLLRFYAKRARRVVFPYVIAFAVFYLYFIYTNRITPSVGGFFRELFSGGLVSHFYFVAIICQFYLLIPLWRLIAEKASPTLTLTVSLILMLILRVYLPEMTRYVFGAEFAYNQRLFTTYLFYFVAGMFAGKYYDRFREFLSLRRRGILILFAVIAVIDCFAIWSIETKLAYLSWADMFHVLYCISAICALLSLAVKYAEKPKKTDSIILTLDAASYNVYLIHPLFIFVSESLLARMGVASLSLRLVFRAVFTYVLAIGLCVGIEKIKQCVRKKHRPAD